MQLRSIVAVAVVQAGSCSSDLTPSLGTSLCHGYGPPKEKKKKVPAYHSTVLQANIREYYDEAFLIINKETNQPISNCHYRIIRGDGSIEEGISDEAGYTHVVKNLNEEI